MHRQRSPHHLILLSAAACAFNSPWSLPTQALIRPHTHPHPLALRPQVGHKVMYVAQPGELTSAHLRADVAGQGQGVQDMRQADSALLPEVEQEAASAAVETAAGAGAVMLWLQRWRCQQNMRCIA